jgi:cyanophycinase
MLSVACAATPVSVQDNVDPRPGSIGISGAISDTISRPIPLIFLGGGSTDQDMAMARFLDAADGGDVSVIRASGSTGYNDYMMGLSRIHSAETFLIDSREAAANPGTNTILSQSEALFIAGGDQWNYVQHWSGTPLDATIRELKEVKRVPYGGTSAGAMILGGRMFDASNGSVTSAEALANPFDAKVSLRSGLFGPAPILQPFLIDTHFSERERQGRLMVFLARSIQPEYAPKGMGIDEKTAFIIDSNGIGTVYGMGFVWMYLPELSLGGPESMTAYTPFTWNRGGRAVRVWKVGHSERFDLNTFQPLDRPAGYYASVVNGVFIITADAE